MDSKEVVCLTNTMYPIMILTKINDTYFLNVEENIVIGKEEIIRELTKEEIKILDNMQKTWEKTNRKAERIKQRTIDYIDSLKMQENIKSILLRKDTLWERTKYINEEISKLKEEKDQIDDEIHKICDKCLDK